MSGTMNGPMIPFVLAIPNALRPYSHRAFDIALGIDKYLLRPTPAQIAAQKKMEAQEAADKGSE